MDTDGEDFREEGFDGETGERTQGTRLWRRSWREDSGSKTSIAYLDGGLWRGGQGYQSTTMEVVITGKPGEAVVAIVMRTGDFCVGG